VRCVDCLLCKTQVNFFFSREPIKRHGTIMP
jgi:hypothetical protein